MLFREMLRAIVVKGLFIHFLCIFVLTGCSVNGSVVVRPQDIGAVVGGRTKSQVKNTLQKNEEKCRVASESGNYDGEYFSLLDYKKALEDAFALSHDKDGSWQSPGIFSGNVHSRSPFFQDINGDISREYSRTIYELLKLAIITERVDAFASLIPLLHQKNPYLSATSVSCLLEFDPSKLSELTAWLEAVVEKYRVVGRQKDAMRILLPLRHELEVASQVLPGGWKYPARMAGKTLRDDFVNCSFVASQLYLEEGEFGRAEDMIKLVLGESVNNDLQVGSMVIAARIKYKLGQQNYARMYLQQALTAISRGSGSRRLNQFFEFASPDLESVFTLLRQEDLVVLSNFPTISDSLANIPDGLLAFSTGRELHRLFILQHILSSKQNELAIKDYQKAYFKLFLDSPPTENAICQLADFACLLVNDKQWRNLVSFYGPLLSNFEYLLLSNKECASDLARMIKAYAMAVYMVEQGGSLPREDEWLPDKESKYSAAEKAFVLSQAALQLEHARNGLIKDFDNELVKRVHLELQAVFKGWLAGKLSDAVYLTKRKEAYDRLALRRNQAGETKLLKTFFIDYLGHLREIRPTATEGVVTFQVVGNRVMYFMFDQRQLRAGFSSWNYDLLKEKILFFRDAAESGDEATIRKFVPELAEGLWGQAAKSLSNFSRIRIVPDRALGMLPFGLLLSQLTPQKDMVAEVRYVPFFQHREHQGSTSAMENKKILLMGDPLPLNVTESMTYSDGLVLDISLALRGVRVRPKKEFSLMTDLSSLPGSELESQFVIGRIPYTKVEVVSIQDIAQKKGYLPQILTGFDYNKENVRKVLQSGWQVVHFSSHAFYTGEIPYILEPAIYTTPGIRPIDSFLLASEIKEMDLQGIKTVVLSACNTGFDITPSGEGITGIANAFLEAGVQNVILTLWAIDDKASSEFMRLFYNELFNGETAASAIQVTKKMMMNEKEFKNSKFWAPFVLYGSS